MTSRKGGWKQLDEGRKNMSGALRALSRHTFSYFALLLLVLLEVGTIFLKLIFRLHTCHLRNVSTLFKLIQREVYEVFMSFNVCSILELRFKFIFCRVGDSRILKRLFSFFTSSTFTTVNLFSKIATPAFFKDPFNFIITSIFNYF